MNIKLFKEKKMHLATDVQNNEFTDEQQNEYYAKMFASQTKSRFEDVKRLINEHGDLIKDQQKAIQDRDQFLRDNEDIKVDQNVARNTDNKKTSLVLFMVMVLGVFFSVKGWQFLLSSLYGSVNFWIIIPIACLFSGCVVVGSIWLNHFAENKKGKDRVAFITGKIAANFLVFFLPIVNLIEGFNSHYELTVMLLNILLCVIDLIAHSSLISMSSTFTIADISNNAKKILVSKENAIKEIDNKYRSFKNRYETAKNSFSSSAIQFVYYLKKIESVNPKVAGEIMFLLPNFLIWMINNKVMQHAVLKYHANENGQPVIDEIYFTPENDAIRKGWDLLSTVSNNSSSVPQDLEVPVSNQQTQLKSDINGYKVEQHSNFINNKVNNQDHEVENTQVLLQDYEEILEDTTSNQNDKTL